MKDSKKTKERLVIEIKELRDSLENQISELKHVENALSESEGKYRKLIETANDAIFIADAETGIILDVNRRAEEMMNMPAEEIVGMHQRQLHPENEAEDYDKIFSEHVQGENGISEEVVVCCKDGQKIPVEISASVIEWGGKKVVQGIFRDITGRKRVEDALSQKKSRCNTFLIIPRLLFILKTLRVNTSSRTVST
ncbi:MAG: PAS domain S-box protein [Candidatus Scalindua sp.]|jgi:PAS domain S-box-containing protein|nr:PAS domain S-box protein [Candidatus Scalindua sp.]MDV5165224.1 PAS domain S-box protein [Candidatus Scalindua sp.]